MKFSEEILTRKVLVEKHPLRIIIAFDWTDEFKKWYKENKIKEWWWIEFEGHKFDVKKHENGESFLIVTEGVHYNHYIHNRVCKILSGI